MGGVWGRERGKMLHGGRKRRNGVQELDVGGVIAAGVGRHIFEELKHGRVGSNDLVERSGERCIGVE